MLKKLSTDKIYVILLTVFSLGLFALTVRMNYFRYTNFDYGKFDLGNMTQMVWNTLNGRFLYLTDYFGTNLPRWAMSHVDPILLFFVPIFAIFPHPLTLVFSQLFLVIFSSLIIYKIGRLELKTGLGAFLIGLAYLFYPSIGFLIAWTGFHGVTVVIPFFLLAFYQLEKMYRKGIFSTKDLVLFWIFLVLTMMGKEELSSIVFMYGIFIFFMRGQKKLGITVSAVGILWFIITFFVIIPHYSSYRIEGYKKFTQELQLDTSLSRDVIKPNYFLSRYSGFGNSYSEVILNMVLNPKKVIRVIFSGDRRDNFRMTFAPMAFTSVLNPYILALSLPEFIINYSTTEGGIGTSEIYNHRISIIIPILFISSIFGISIFSSFFKKKDVLVSLILCALVLSSNIYTSLKYENPVYLWLIQSVKKRVAFAKIDNDISSKKDLKVGEVVRLTKLETKDRECANKIIDLIPEKASVSGPDYLGAHLAKRETYAIFPALYTSADYVIVDIFSQKIFRILDLDISIVRDVVGDVIKNENYELSNACGNLFVFKKVGIHGKTKLLPFQEKFVYPEKSSYLIMQSIYVVDYSLPEIFTRNVSQDVKFSYIRRAGDDLGDYFLFMSFVNEDTGEIYQVANLPSFGLAQMRDWKEDHYYLEDLQIVLPEYLVKGKYKTFVGMSNNVKTRSLYLGEVNVL